MIIGTAGHIDHGKTALVRALTGIDTDRLKEEKARGISIDLGFAYLPAPDGMVLGFVDVPGHDKFVHNMLAGAAGIDFVLLVVAADDSVMPQTREHLAIVDLLGVSRGVVALTKVDLVSAEQREKASAEIARSLDGTSLSGSDIVPISVVSGQGVAALRERLFAAAQAAEISVSNGRFRLSVDRSFSLTGVGTVVTGTVLSGVVTIGDHVIISPSGVSARIRSIHAQNRPTNRGQAGERCALNLAGDGVAKDVIRRGDVVVDPDLHAPADRIDVTLRVLASEPKSITQWMPVRLHHAANEVGARVVLLGDGAIAPGERALIQVVLERPVAAAVGDRFVLRDTSAQRTIGGGRFLDLRAPARKRRSPERMAQLDAYAIDDPKGVITALFECAPGYVDLTGFARDRALSADEIERLVERLRLVRIPAPSRVIALSQMRWEQLERSIFDRLTAFHAENPDLPGLGLERLRRQLEPRLPAAAFAAALQALARVNQVAMDGGWVRLPSHKVRLTAAEETLWLQARPLIADKERFRPPRVRDVANMIDKGETEIRQLFKLLGRLGKLDEVAHDHFFLRGAVVEMVEIAAALAAQSPNGQFSAAEFRDRLNNGRKVAIQILEFFDRRGVTMRRGDLRRINKHRLDLFSRPTNEQQLSLNTGRESSPVGRPDFKSGKGRKPVFGGFDSHSLPPKPRPQPSTLVRQTQSNGDKP
jgi:selenocysteine-specific elongation factor